MTLEKKYAPVHVRIYTFQNPEIYEPIFQSMDEITNAVMKTYDQMCENCDYVTISKAYSDLEVSTSKMFSKYENYILPHFLTFKCCSNK